MKKHGGQKEAIETVEIGSLERSQDSKDRGMYTMESIVLSVVLANCRMDEKREKRKKRKKKKRAHLEFKDIVVTAFRHGKEPLGNPCVFPRAVVAR
jgi:hypothetical protein